MQCITQRVFAFKLEILLSCLRYDVQVWRDEKNNRYRMDSYGSTNMLIATKVKDCVEACGGAAGPAHAC